MFDTISGLPVHVLVVHGVVVLVPLLSLVTIAFVLRPKWRDELGWAVLGNAVCVVLAFVARESGEKFKDRLGISGEAIDKHVEYGDVLWLFALGLLVASVIAWVLVNRGTGGIVVAGVLVIVAAVAATGWTVLTGDSGSRAVWEDAITSTNK